MTRENLSNLRPVSRLRPFERTIFGIGEVSAVLVTFTAPMGAPSDVTRGD
jgi:hypothetical protein